MGNTTNGNKQVMIFLQYKLGTMVTLSYIPIHCTFRCSTHDSKYLIQILGQLVLIRILKSLVKNTAFYKLCSCKASPLTPIHSHELDVR